MPRDLFAEQNIENEAGPRDLFAERGISLDNMSQESNSYLGNLLRDAQSEWQTAKHIPGNLATGFVKFGNELANIPHRLNPENPAVYPNFDYGEFFGVGNPNDQDKFTQGLAQYAPAMLVPAARIAKLAPIAADASILARAGTGALNALKTGINYAPGQALYGASQNVKEGENPYEGGSEMAALSILGVPALQGVGKLGKGVKSLLTDARPAGEMIANKSTELLGDILARTFPSKLSSEELIRNARAAQGTSTQLGEVVANPNMKRFYENVLQNVPFSGARPALEDTAAIVKQRNENLMDALRGNHDPSDTPEILTEEVQRLYKEQQQIKNAAYEKVDKLAATHNVPFSASNFEKVANEYAEDLEGTNILQYEPEGRRLLKKLQNYKNAAKFEPEFQNTKGETVQDVQMPTIKEMNILAGKFGKKANDFSLPMGERQIYGKLRQAIKTDIKESIDNFHEYLPENEKWRAEEVKNAFKEAERNYAENFSPYLDRKVARVATDPKFDSDTIVSMFMPNARMAKRTNLLRTLTDRLPVDKRSLFLHEVLSKRAMDAEGNLNPLKWRTALNNIPEEQLRELIPDPIMRNALRDQAKLIGMNTEGLQAMLNPLTGQRVTTGGGILTAAGLLGHPFSALGVVGGANIAQRALTNENLRKEIVKNMLKLKARKGK